MSRHIFFLMTDHIFIQAFCAKQILLESILILIVLHHITPMSMLRSVYIWVCRYICIQYVNIRIGQGKPLAPYVEYISMTEH